MEATARIWPEADYLEAVLHDSHKAPLSSNVNSTLGSVRILDQGQESIEEP